VNSFYLPTSQQVKRRGSKPYELDEDSCNEGDNLDNLLDMVLDMAPTTSRKDSQPQAAAEPKHSASTPLQTGSVARRSSGSEETPVSPKVPLKQHQRLPPLGVRTSQEEQPQLTPVAFPDFPVLAPRAVQAQRHSITSFEDLDGVLRLVVQAYAAVNVAPACGQIPEALGPGHVLSLFSGRLQQGGQAPEVKWLHDHPEFRELTLKAFRYALKVTIDCVAMAEDASALEYSELEVALLELERGWHFGEESSMEWQAAMERRVPNLMALRRTRTSDMQVLRHCLREDGVRVGELKPEVVQSIWASESLELRYLTNDDDERYSIQAHPTLLRNMIVQSAEYPIYVSPPTTVWL